MATVDGNPENSVEAQLQQLALVKARTEGISLERAVRELSLDLVPGERERLWEVDAAAKAFVEASPSLVGDPMFDRLAQAVKQLGR